MIPVQDSFPTINEDILGYVESVLDNSIDDLQEDEDVYEVGVAVIPWFLY